MSRTVPDRYAVMGNPVAHSKSPRIHALFAQQTDQNLVYTAILVERGRFDDALDEFQASGGKGLNITVPFKEEAWRLMDARSERAQAAGAVNTILFRPDGTRYGDNTDGVGLVRDLEDNQGVALADRRILLIGAGGAARGVLGALLNARPARLAIANRTVEKAVALAEVFSGQGPVEGCGFGELAGERFDLIINATAAGLSGQVPDVPRTLLDGRVVCYDLMYGDEPTAFVRWAREGGAGRALDGLGMLVEQAAESFYLWRGVRPRTAPVIQALRPASVS